MKYYTNGAYYCTNGLFPIKDLWDSETKSWFFHQLQNHKKMKKIASFKYDPKSTQLELDQFCLYNSTLMHLSYFLDSTIMLSIPCYYRFSLCCSFFHHNHKQWTLNSNNANSKFSFEITPCRDKRKQRGDALVLVQGIPWFVISAIYSVNSFSNHILVRIISESVKYDCSTVLTGHQQQHNCYVLCQITIT